jgi:hypothetical protein
MPRLTSAEYLRAYKEGQQAFANMLQCSDNPYTALMDDQFFGWENGWVDDQQAAWDKLIESF